MSDEVYLDAFAAWLGTLAHDANTLAAAMDGGVGAESEALVGGLNYLFKSLDLIPDGIEDLGYLDDAFVMRVAAKHAKEAGVQHVGVAALAQQASTIESFLGADYARLDAYVSSTRAGSVRGRTPEQILTDEGIRSSFLGELSGWAAQYQAPSFSKQPRTLVKLRSFLSAKLP
jgi:uncharacterized membrane protein YkvA (DUF1232 family)